MFIDQLQKQQEFTASERAIAEYLLSRAGGTVHTLSTAELARETHTSKATIIRLCQKLGAASYREFLHTLEGELRELQRINARIREDPVNASMNYDDVLGVLPTLYDEAISSAAIQLDKAAVYRAVQRIRQARKVDLYGSGITHSIAQLSAFKFSTLGIECGTYSGLNEHYILADREPSNKAVVIFSLTGGNPNMIYIAQWLKRRNYYVLGIGGSVKAGLAELCTDYIALPMEKNVLGAEVMKAFTMINYAVDVLFTLLLARDYQHNHEVAVRLLREQSETEESK